MSDGDAIYGNDQSGLPDLVGIAAKQIVERARQLGLTWTLRMATVGTNTSDLLTVIFDGDTIALPVVNMTGQSLVTGSRVYVLIVPPGGNFVVGFSGLTPASVVFVASQANTGIVGAETPVLTTPSAQYLAGRTYAGTFYGDTLGDPNVTVVYRMRRTNVVGTAFGASAYQMNVINPAFTQHCSGRYLFTPSTNITDTFVLTLEGFGGNAIMFGNVNQTRYFEIVDCGPTSSYPNVPFV
jgi:hypothetical protein